MLRSRPTWPCSRRSRAGFTLVEIVLVLALLALGGTILVSAAGSIFERGRAASAEEVVADVLQQARRAAVLTGREVAMRFDEATQRLVWDGSDGVGFGPERKGTRVEFLRASAGGSVLIGGRLVETAEVPAVRFFPDGTCERVRVQIRAPGGVVRVMAIDPWTCAPGLEERT